MYNGVGKIMKIGSWNLLTNITRRFWEFIKNKRRNEK